jgi:fructose/tagatose bisphosphate aldolase
VWTLIGTQTLSNENITKNIRYFYLKINIKGNTIYAKWNAVGSHLYADSKNINLIEAESRVVITKD